MFKGIRRIVTSVIILLLVCGNAFGQEVWKEAFHKGNKEEAKKQFFSKLDSYGSLNSQMGSFVFMFQGTQWIGLAAIVDDAKGDKKQEALDFAIVVCTEGLNYYPKKLSDFVLRMRGDYYLRAKKYESAIADYEAIIKSKNKELGKEQAYLEYANFLCNTTEDKYRDVPRAISLAEKAAKLSEKNKTGGIPRSTAYRILSNAYAKNNELDKAISTQKKALYAIEKAIKKTESDNKNEKNENKLKMNNQGLKNLMKTKNEIEDTLIEYQKRKDESS